MVGQLEAHRQVDIAARELETAERRIADAHACKINPLRISEFYFDPTWQRPVFWVKP